ncbi:Flp pilus assembly protein TadG [Novosphingobium chloroacetimidivorans]|uniref:Flp pilus assembly protein TadG n=1 Tax=Novosphingobium chloroacetimidivorans TaxID=1428314 RepID=A0A7W7NWS2_9SPHN|nr:TadE/TadG family type IV pilus assembly protein [Novosphingobium chloroacetimidivorans]MBB4858709.1 Flp pilus assembly protein TadG [Novosphingobium chloroacetimidivorans]
MPRVTNPVSARRARSAFRIGGWLRRLARDQRGNTFLIVAAAIIPMLAVVGGGVDISRGYLSRTRLQQACDAGVLATRKKIGGTVITNQVIPTDANAVGTRFFNLNFQDGAYGTSGRTFAMTLSPDYTINGTASVSVPTSVMKLFAVDALPVTVQCSAQFHYANTDIMMVLDVTGSMNETNTGDTSPKISVLRQTVKDFYASIESNKTQGTRIRWGFVPYSTNVNVGYLLKSGWIADSTDLESRTAVNSGWNAKWRYQTETVNVSSLKSGASSNLPKGTSLNMKIGGTAASPSQVAVPFEGCIEERKTYVINDYNNVDLTKARDLDIDAVPDSSKPDTQWHIMLRDVSYLRAVNSWGGYWSPSAVESSSDYVNAADYGFAACPAESRKLAEMTASQVATYVDGLVPAGSTYHDIGMIWGGRLISPTGIFASENGDVNGRPSSRHLIFLTDGQTAPSDFSYGTYGIEPLSQRRWNSSSPYNLTQTVEKRFSYACNQVKNKNVTVWVIGFGTTVPTLMKDCAGSGHWFQAANSTQLSNAFAAIAASIGDLRIIK